MTSHRSHRIRRHRYLTALTAAGLVVAGAGIAHADQIANTLDSSIDSVAEAMPLNAGGAVGTTTLYISPTNGDGRNGCNLKGATSTVTLAVASSDPSVATVSPSTLTFTSCGDTETLTVVPVAIGSATVSATVVANTTGGSFDTAPATFDVTVSAPAPANTAPSVTVEGVTEGASYPAGAVPPATCDVVDVEDGTLSFPAALSALTGPDAAFGVGTQTASCSYTDAGGLTAQSSKTYSVVDSTPPTISYVLSPATPDGSAGWYRSDVSLVWTVTEPQSPSSLVTAGCEERTVTTDQPATDYTCSATSDGGVAMPVTVTVKRDATAPVVTGTVISTPVTVGSTTWYKDTATVSFDAIDALSGVLAGSLSPTSTTLGEGVDQSAGAAADDVAGNHGTGLVSGIDVDASAPVVQLTCPSQPVLLGSSATAGWSASDTGSGLAGDSSGTVPLDTKAVGTRTATAPTVSDNVGHTSATTTCSYDVVFDWSGFFQPVDNDGVLNVVKAGSAVPVKFSLHGDQGLGILAPGYPKATAVQCSATAAVDTLESVTGTTSGLKYDATADQYNYTWKTASSSAGTCQQLTVRLTDGTSHTALFKFTR